MKNLLVAINAKYIHTNLAIRSLRANTTYPVTLMEFSIKEHIDSVKEAILRENPDVIGFSVYIWNVELIKQLLEKMSVYQGRVVLGGPEVSYDATSFFEYPVVDYVICGEGEQAFQELLESINGLRSIESVSNLTYRDGQEIRQNNPKSNPNLRTLRFDESEEDDVVHRVQYVEMSRGCPYRCSYCLASLEKSVRFFPMDKVLAHLDFLSSRGAKVIKFLDRTFNSDMQKATQVIDYLIGHHKVGQSFQFEITADRLTKEFIEHVNLISPPNLFRFEIGIQSLSVKSNLAVHRKQNNEKLFENIRLLQSGGKVDLHLDLIAGLPFETKESFQNTFDQVFSLHAKELQLGFLKLLKGTRLREEASLWQYEFDFYSPYQIHSSSTLSASDLSIISSVEAALEVFWNRGFMTKSFLLLTMHHESVFELFLELENEIKSKGMSLARFQMDELFLAVRDFYRQKGYPNFETFEYQLQKDYLSYFPIKPKKWWSIENRGSVIESFHEIYPDIPLDDFYKYGVLFGNLRRVGIVLFDPKGKRILETKSSQL